MQVAARELEGRAAAPLVGRGLLPAFGREPGGRLLRLFDDRDGPGFGPRDDLGGPALGLGDPLLLDAFDQLSDLNVHGHLARESGPGSGRDHDNPVRLKSER